MTNKKKRQRLHNEQCWMLKVSIQMVEQKEDAAGRLDSNTVQEAKSQHRKEKANHKEGGY
jgi:hypothetical protein